MVVAAVISTVLAYGAWPLALSLFSRPERVWRFSGIAVFVLSGAATYLWFLTERGGASFPWTLVGIFVGLSGIMLGATVLMVDTVRTRLLASSLNQRVLFASLCVLLIATGAYGWIETARVAGS